MDLAAADIMHAREAKALGSKRLASTESRDDRAQTSPRSGATKSMSGDMKRATQAFMYKRSGEGTWGWGEGHSRGGCPSEHEEEAATRRRRFLRASLGRPEVACSRAVSAVDWTATSALDATITPAMEVACVQGATVRNRLKNPVTSRELGPQGRDVWWVGGLEGKA